MALREDVAAAMGGDSSALERPKKGKGKRSVSEIVASLNPKQRQALRSRAEKILEALDAIESAESKSEPESEEELI
jgi:predicted CopG family antitoxin